MRLRVKQELSWRRWRLKWLVKGLQPIQMVVFKVKNSVTGVRLQQLLLLLKLKLPRPPRQ